MMTLSVTEKGQNEPLEDLVEKTRGILKGKSSLLKSLLDDRKKEAPKQW